MPRRRDCDDSSRMRSACAELPAGAPDEGVRCDEVLGGGMGPLPVDAVAVLFTAGEVCVDGGSACPRGVVMLDGLEVVDEW